MPWSRYDIARTWTIAAQICETATNWITGTEAQHDPCARAALVAAARHRLIGDVLGPLVAAEVLHEDAADLAEQLHDLDQPPRDDETPS